MFSRSYTAREQKPGQRVSPLADAYRPEVMETEPITQEPREGVALARGATLDGLNAEAVEVEVRLLRGILGVVKILGLRETEAKESRERVRSAIRAVQLDFPERSMLLNLAPAECRKQGPGLDLALVAGILAVTGQVPAAAAERVLCWGEVSLDGRVRPVRGALPVALLARRLGVRHLIVPAESAREVSRVQHLSALPIRDVRELHEVLHGELPAVCAPVDPPREAVSGSSVWDSIVGQDDAKTAVTASAVGGHHLLLTGPPGTGKSMLARGLAGLLPDLDEASALEVSCIHSAAGLAPRLDTCRPPLRAPHCSVTVAGMAGGGASPRPGEMTLAHHGLLFLDELPQFRREVHDLLRAPLEDGCVLLSRAGRSVRYPSRFLLVAAMNPCPCGYAGEVAAACSCSAAQILRYRSKLSGPVLDRIDLTVHVPFVPAELRRSSPPGLQSKVVRDRVAELRTQQMARNGGVPNALIPADRLGEIAALEQSAEDWLATRIDRLRLSVRAHHRLLRVARSFADLRDAEQVGRPDLARALRLRDTTRDG